MSDLFLSTEFWFGAAVLGAYQFAKFSELSSLDPEFAARSAPIPNLRAIDFAGKVTYCATLVAFLAATLLIYFVLCKVSPHHPARLGSRIRRDAERGPADVRRLGQLSSLHRSRIHRLYAAGHSLALEHWERAAEPLPCLDGSPQSGHEHVELLRQPDLHAESGYQAVGQGTAGVDQRRLGGADRRLRRRGVLPGSPRPAEARR